MYTCRLILHLSSLSYTEFQDVAEVCFQGLQVKLDCQDNDLKILTVSGFSTEDHAIAYLDKLNTAFYWLMLRSEIIAEAAMELEEIQRHSNVKHGCNFTSIEGRPSTHIFEIPYGFVHATYEGGGSIVDASIVLDGLREGLEIATRIIPKLDEKLRISLDLYRSSTLQENLKARFTMLITSMECLVNEVKRDDWQIKLIEKFIDDVNAYQIITDQDDLRDELRDKKERMVGGLSNLKNEPKWLLIEQEIREAYEGVEGSQGMEITIKKLFKRRHRIVHQGSEVTRQEVDCLASATKALLMNRISSLPKRELFEDLF